jgi:hypothetical protein
VWGFAVVYWRKATVPSIKKFKHIKKAKITHHTNNQSKKKKKETT